MKPVVLRNSCGLSPVGILVPTKDHGCCECGSQHRWGCCCHCLVIRSCLTALNPWTAARQASLSFTISWSLLRSSCPLHRWCHPTISSSVVPFSSCLQSFPASGSFPVSQFFPSGGQSTGASVSASVLPGSMRLCCCNKWSWISVMASRVLFLFLFRFYCICYSIGSALCFGFVGDQACGVLASRPGIEPPPPRWRVKS